MKYFFINTSPIEDDVFCFFTDPPVGIETIDYKISTGRPTAFEYPDDAEIHMSQEFSGLKLPDLMGNTRSLLTVSRLLRDGIAAHTASPVEYLPVAVFDHKGRRSNKEYFFINPLTIVECLDLAKSDIQWFQGDVVTVRRFALDPQKLDGLPDLFRIPQEPTQYVVSETLARALVPLNPSNVFLIELTDAS